MNNGESITFNYTGGVQSFTIPETGIYKLEVYGACGGGCYAGGISYGGYSKGYKELKKGTIIYITVGGAGQSSGGFSGYRDGGYNGGGGAYSKNGSDQWKSSGSGGGATHIAFVSGTLASIGQTTFNQQGLIVAGGGGGAHRYKTTNYAGGQGGGLRTGSTGYGFGVGETTGDGYSRGSGGGGGYYGGETVYKGAAYGGTGWIEGVTSYNGDSATTSYGGNSSGNGYARITLTKKKSIKLGDVDCTVYLGATEISSIYRGGTEL